MKIFQKRFVAALVMVLAILAGIGLSRARAPAAGGGITGSFTYIVHNEGGAVSQSTAQYIEAMNASLFAQTGAQIVVDVVKTTGSQDIADYAEDLFTRRGIGSRERNNGLLLVLALENMFNGAPDGDYYIAWGSGFSASQQDRLDGILWENMETGFASKRYDAAVRTTFDALVDYLEDIYHVNVTTAAPSAAGNYQSISGGYESAGTAVLPEVFIGEIVFLLAILFVLWIILDAMRYSRYRRRYIRPGFPPPPRYYPIFWGRPRRVRTPPPPRPPAGGGFGGGAGRRTGGFSGGGSFGGGAGRRTTSSSGGARRSSGRTVKAPRSSGRSSPPRRSGGGGRRR